MRTLCENPDQFAYVKEDLARVPGVMNVADAGNFQELRLNPGVDSQQVLTALMAQS